MHTHAEQEDANEFLVGSPYRRSGTLNSSGKLSHNGELDNVSFVERLSGPISQLGSILKEIMKYKMDAFSAAHAAKEYAQVLENERDPDKLLRILTDIRNVSRNEAARHGLLTCPELIRALVVLLQRKSQFELQTNAASCLQQLTKAEDGAKLICEELGIPALVEMLRHPSEIIVTTALYVLNMMMWHLPEKTRPEVRCCQGHMKLADLLLDGRLTDPNWLVVCIDAIRMTAYGCDQTKIDLLGTNLHSDMVRLIRVYSNNSKLVYNVARLIKVLGTCNKNKVKLVESGVIEVLTDFLESDNGPLQLETLWGMRNISDHAFHLINTDRLIGILIHLLSSSDENVAICAAGCLCNLTCQNAHNKGLVVENDGVKFLCQLLNLNYTRQEISEPICSALRHVTHRNPHAQSAIYEIRMNNTLPTIAQLISETDILARLPLIKSVVGLIRNVATEAESLEKLKSDGVVDACIGIVRIIDKTVRNQSVPHSPSNVTPTTSECFVDGVNLKDMLELLLATFQVMAKDAEICEKLVYTAGLLTIVVQLLYSTSESMQHAAAAVLSQLSNTKYGCSAIERQGVCPRLTELIQSNNEFVASYAAALLHRIAQDKPEDYKRRLSLELKQALFDGGLSADTGQPSGALETRRNSTTEPLSLKTGGRR